jgi:hypothetical protein
VNLPLVVLLLSAIIHVSGYILLALRIEPFMYDFYLTAWWSYIAFVDAALALKSGRFRVLNRNLPFLVLVSSAFWCISELINLRIQNWYYINIPGYGLIRFIGYLVAYGTVIPGIYITKEALASLLGELRVRPLCVRGYAGFCMGLGLVSFVLLLLFPYHLFFLAWVFPVLLLEGYCYAKGHWCFMKDLEQGSAANLVSSLLAGLVCGFLWETWNYWAISKWVYTVPYFESVKLFEMPILGYGGFLLFALETVLFFSLVNDSPLVKRHHFVAGTLALALSLFSFAMIDRYTIFSYTATVDELTFLDRKTRDELKRDGVWTSFAIDPTRLKPEERHLLELVHLKGLGVANVLKLKDRSVSSVRDLSRLNEEELAGIIGEKNRQRVRVYINAARGLRHVVY